MLVPYIFFAILPQSVCVGIYYPMFRIRDPDSVTTILCSLQTLKVAEKTSKCTV